MFAQILNLSKFSSNDKLYDFLYDIFKNDFIVNKCYLAQKIYIDPISNDKNNGKEKVFWHIITRKQKGKRVLDNQRACRIKWVRKIIDNYCDNRIKMFYYFEDSKKIRLYLWVYSYDFVVILQRLGKSSSYLVTSFYIDNQKKRDKFQKKYEDYINKADKRLNSCEWF